MDYKAHHFPSVQVSLLESILFIQLFFCFKIPKKS